MWQKAGTALPATLLEGKKKSPLIVSSGAFLYFLGFFFPQIRNAEAEIAMQREGTLKFLWMR